MRITGYAIDGGPIQSVAPTTSPLGIAVVMNGPHTMTFSTVRQFQVSLDAGATEAVNSSTPPTIPGDSYWYDTGSQVSIVLNGAWGRQAGTGHRLVSLTIGGNLSIVDTTSTIPLRFDSSAPVAVTSVVATQYHVDTSSGSLSSITSPPIAGDSGWYDSGTTIHASYDYTWNVTAKSRTSATSFSINGSPSTIGRHGSGVFPVQFRLDSPSTVTIESVVQYGLGITGGYNATASQVSPTGDQFYDSGTQLTVSTPYVWDSAGGSRQSLYSYSIDGADTNVTRADSGLYSTPVIDMTGSHAVGFKSATQYLIAFKFTDAAGTQGIMPTSLSINANGATIDVSGLRVWLDDKTAFTLNAVIWENSDVRPSATPYAADAPQNLTIRAQVYAAHLRLVDLLGQPVVGSQVSLTLANGTTITRTTLGDGSVTVPLIPLGTFKATGTYLGVPFQVLGDESQQNVVQESVIASYPDFGLFMAIGAAAIVAVALLVRRRRSAPARSV